MPVTTVPEKTKATAKQPSIMAPKSISHRLKKRWKIFVGIGLVWFWAVFPIPFIPFFGFQLGESAIQALIIISIVLTIPFTLLALFMKDYQEKNDE